MNIKLFFHAITKFLLGLVIVFLLLFVSAGTLNYWNGWFFIGILFVPMFAVGIILLIKNPELLKKRLEVTEQQSEQKQVILFSGLMFILGFVSAGLDYRFKWAQLPNVIVIIFSVLFVIAYILYVEVLRENTHLFRIIQVKKDQKVIDTGLYKIVRHPMYAATILLFLSVPLILGSAISFAIFLIYPFIIVKRINSEEKILEKDLEGYAEYKKKVKYKVIPFVW